MVAITVEDIPLLEVMVLAMARLFMEAGIMEDFTQISMATATIIFGMVATCTVSQLAVGTMAAMEDGMEAMDPGMTMQDMDLPFSDMATMDWEEPAAIDSMGATGLEAASTEELGTLLPFTTSRVECLSIDLKYCT